MTSTIDAPEGNTSVRVDVPRGTPAWIATAAARVGRSRVKRFMDIVISGLALLVLSPLLLLIVVAIRLDSRGPAIYRQERYGRGRRFTIYKFRSMSAEASRAEFRQ